MAVRSNKADASLIHGLAGPSAPMVGIAALPMWQGYAAAATGVVLSTVGLTMLQHWLEWGEVALIYLSLVIAIASRAGFGPALFAAFISFCCCDYLFMPPLYTFANSSRGWLSLAVFLFVAIVTAHLASLVRDEATKAAARAQETTILYQASQAISSQVDADRLLPTVADEIIRLTNAAECAVLVYTPDDNSLAVAAYSSADRSSDGPNTSESDDWKNRVAVECVSRTVLEHCQTTGQDPATDPETMADGATLVIPAEWEATAGIYQALLSQGEPVGVLYVRGQTDALTFTAQESRLMRTLANDATVVIVRQRLTEQAEDRARRTAILDERNRLARDVHDALSHTFTGIKFLLEAVDRVGPSPEAMDCIAEARKLAVEGAQEARRSVLALRPVTLETAGDLAEAIRHLARHKTATGSIQIDVQISGDIRPLPDLIEENLLRACQEALANALKHSEAEEVIIRLAYAPETITLSVQDDGSGFDPASVPDGRGFGLIGMRQRCSRIGATFKLESAIGTGTTIAIHASTRMPNEKNHRSSGTRKVG